MKYWESSYHSNIGQLQGRLAEYWESSYHSNIGQLQGRLAEYWESSYHSNIGQLQGRQWNTGNPLTTQTLNNCKEDTWLNLWLCIRLPRLDDTKENAYPYARILPTIQRNQEKDRKKCQEEQQIMDISFAGGDITDISAWADLKHTNCGFASFSAQRLD